MDSREVELVRMFGADTSEALAHFLRGEPEVGLAILHNLVSLLDAMVAGNGGGDGSGSDGSPNPGPGQLEQDGSFITVGNWFIPNEWPVPTGPDGSEIPLDFVWAPNAPNQESPDWQTAEWVWRPPLA